MDRSGAIAVLRRATRLHDPYRDAEYDPRYADWDEAPMCIYSEKGVHDIVRDQFYPFEEWAFAGRNGQQMGAFRTTNYAVIRVQTPSDWYVYRSPPAICYAYRRKLPAPADEVRQELREVATALVFLGAKPN
jgi:hypothetical protein